MRERPLILVTGSNGQLGKELKALADSYPGFEFSFLSKTDMPIHHFELVRHFFDTLKPDYCINAAAYTAVDKAEEEPDRAFQINGEAVGVLAAICKEHHTKFIHISTDYVFDGTGSVPYTENYPTDPVNTYGMSKLEGEKQAMRLNPETIIIRTSWLYAVHGKNFVTTMLKLMSYGNDIRVVNDQQGSPTFAGDLAAAILKIIEGAKEKTENWKPGIYHFSNGGKISWYDLAVAIKELTNATNNIKPISTAEYPTPAKRPAFSVLDTSKISGEFGIEIKPWKESLEKCFGQVH